MLVAELKSDLVSDALGCLYMSAPARRDEITAFCLRTGLRITVDG
jgi:hypothetical protein